MRQRLLTGAAGLIAAVTAIIWVGQAADPRETIPTPLSPPTHTEALPATVEPVASATPAAAGPGRDAAAGRLYTYAIPTTELQGLSPNAAPGSRLDLWVAWQPPVTERTDVQLLLKGVILESIVPPTTPDGPHSAILQVPPARARRLIWGDRFGALSVLTPTAPRL